MNWMILFLKFANLLIDSTYKMETNAVSWLY
jgi:hypothetical protein